MNTLFLHNRVFENWTPSWREREVEVEALAVREPQPGFDRDRSRRESVTPESRNSRSRSRAQSPSSTSPPSLSRSHSPAASTISTASSASDSSSEFDFDRTPDREPSSYNAGTTTTYTTMAERELHSIIKSLHGCVRNHNYTDSASLLGRAKLALLHLNALIPSPKSSTEHLKLARETLELGALISIRQQSPADFTRYYQQLQPFYALPAKQLPRQGSQASKITGLYLLLLLTQNDNAGFHTLLEGLEVLSAQEGHSLEDDESIQYPVKLQEALMEGSYDRVWGLTGRDRVPSEEFGIFADVCYPSNHVALILAGMLTDFSRSSSTPSAHKLRSTAKRPIRRSLYPTPKVYSSSTAKAPW